MSFHADRLREVQSFYRLPGFVFTESLMAFWKCSRSTAALHHLRPTGALQAHGAALLTLLETITSGP